MEITLEEIQKKFDSLPEDLKWAIMAAKVDENILEIGKLHNLTVEQMGQLSLETHMVMFGFTAPDEFEKSLTESLGLGEEKTKKVVTDINEKILKGIRVQLMSFHKNNEDQKISTEKSNEHEIMKSAGIEIIPTEETISYNNTGDNKNKLSDTPILAQKLAGTFQIPAVKTEHTLGNLSSNSGEVSKTNEQKDIPKSGYAVDPYRMSPE